MNFGRSFQKIAPNLRLSGRYQVVRRLGMGGFSETFLAKDTQLPGQPDCVIKQLKPQSRNLNRWQVAKRLFDTEATVLYRLGDHERIPRLFAHFEDNQNFYLVQEYIEGESLRQKIIADQPWSEASVIVLLQDILQILAYVHAQNVIHRDLKPSNLICRKADGKMVLIDFGAVKQVSAQTADALNEHSTTIAIGTHGYMPIEQLSGAPRFNSDIYALGIIGIEALTGVRPNQLRRDAQTGEIIWQGVGLAAVQVDPKFAEILDRMVRSHFKERYQTAQAALQDLDALLAQRSDIDPEVEFAALATESTPFLERIGRDLDAYSQPLPPPSPLPIPQEQETENSAFATAAETIASTQTRFTALITVMTQKVVALQQIPIRATSQILSVARSPGRALRRLSRSRTIPWRLLVGVGGVTVLSAVGLTSVMSNRLQIDVSKSPPVDVSKSPPVDVSKSLPDTLPCREPSPPPLPSGEPNFVYPDGARYYGSVAKGLPADGRVIIVFPTGNRYDGEFKNGKRNGCGIYTFANGRRYVGQFQNDQFNGKGMWLLDNGERYVGGFKDNRCHGQGTFIFKDGKTTKGTWQNGELEGTKLSCNR